MTTYVELCAGAAACTMRLLGGHRLIPPCSYMGGKRALSAELLRILDVRRDEVERIVLVDAGPWGWVWPILFGPTGEEVANLLETWDRNLDTEGPRELWERLSAIEPGPGPRGYWEAAQWLWLQARSASGVPVWFGPDLSEKGWRMGEEPEKALRATRTIAQCSGAHGWRQAAGAGDAREDLQARDRGSRWKRSPSGKEKARAAAFSNDTRWPHGGIVRPKTIADRIRSIRSARERWPGELQVIHGDVRSLEPIPGAAVLFDPPYEGRTGYGWTLPRADVVQVATNWSLVGARIAVCEAEPLPLPGWQVIDLTVRKPEVVTAFGCKTVQPVRQERLWAEITTG